jgi:hypothetical protein
VGPELDAVDRRIIVSWGGRCGGALAQVQPLWCALLPAEDRQAMGCRRSGAGFNDAIWRGTPACRAT